jgi:hypothetical protein
MKYGSSFIIKVEDLWSKKTLFEQQVVLSDNINAARTFNEVLDSIKKWRESEIRAAKDSLSDADILAIARQRNLLVSNPVKTPHYPLADLYFVESLSGKTKGHFIRLFLDGSVDCTCPGFQNKRKCYVSTQLKETPYYYTFGKWGASVAEFYNQVKIAYPDISYTTAS